MDWDPETAVPSELCLQQLGLEALLSVADEKGKN